MLCSPRTAGPRDVLLEKGATPPARLPLALARACFDSEELEHPALGGVAPTLDDQPAHLRAERAPPGVGGDYPSGRSQLAPDLARDRGERRVLRGEIGLELLPDGAGEGGAGAARRDRHREVAPAHERRKGEGAVRRVVGGIDPDASLPCLARHGRVDLARGVWVNAAD